jgi:hypothetical protein
MGCRRLKMVFERKIQNYKTFLMLGIIYRLVDYLVTNRLFSNALKSIPAIQPLFK